MDKIIKIGDKEVTLRATAGILTMYRAQFNRDGLKDIMAFSNNMNKSLNDAKKLALEQGGEYTSYIDMTVIDTDLIVNLTWTMAKKANSSIPPVDDWLDTFDTFPINEVLAPVFELIMGTMFSSKPSDAVKKK